MLTHNMKERNSSWFFSLVLHKAFFFGQTKANSSIRYSTGHTGQLKYFGGFTSVNAVLQRHPTVVKINVDQYRWW